MRGKVAVEGALRNREGGRTCLQLGKNGDDTENAPSQTSSLAERAVYARRAARRWRGGVGRT